jgi:uncharacterized protein (TIGR02444 family)
VSGDWPPSAFWDWSVEAYARPGVATLCLGLQERTGADVNLLLLACWLADRGQRLEPALVAAGQRWQMEVVRPLRAARRALQARLAEAAAPEIARLRRAIAAAELAAERLEQIELGQLARGVKSTATAGRALALANLDRLGGWAASEQPALLDLVGAVLPSDKKFPAIPAG